MLVGGNAGPRRDLKFAMGAIDCRPALNFENRQVGKILLSHAAHGFGSGPVRDAEIEDEHREESGNPPAKRAMSKKMGHPRTSLSFQSGNRAGPHRLQLVNANSRFWRAPAKKRCGGCLDRCVLFLRHVMWRFGGPVRPRVRHLRKRTSEKSNRWSGRSPNLERRPLLLLIANIDVACRMLWIPRKSSLGLVANHNHEWDSRFRWN